MNESLTIRTGKGVAWTSIAQFTVQLLNFGVFIILARTLEPKDFGLVGMAAVILGFVMTLKEFGLGISIIQRQDLEERHLTTAFWLNLGSSLFIFGLIVIISPFAAVFYKTQEVRNIMIVSSIGLIFSPLWMVNAALLNKNLEFKKIGILQIINRTVAGVSSVIFALLGFGYWSLILCELAAMPVSVLYWRINSWRPSFRFDWQSGKELLSFGLNATGTKVLTYTANNIDYLMVGKYLGAASLGIYTFAFQLMTWPMRKISSMVTQVVFPSFSMIQDDDERLRRGYLKLVSYISIITFPMMAGLFIVAPEFVVGLYGSKWAPAVLPLQIMCLAGLIRSVVTTVGSIFLAKGRADIEFKWNIAYATIVITGILIGISYGVTGVAVAITVILVICGPIVQMIMNRLIGLRWSDYLQGLLPAISASALMSAFIVLLTSLLRKYNLPDLVILALAVGSGISIYVIIIKRRFPTVYNEARSLISALLK